MGRKEASKTCEGQDTSQKRSVVRWSLGFFLYLVEPQLCFKQSSEVVRFAYRKLSDCGEVIGLEESE